MNGCTQPFLKFDRVTRPFLKFDRATRPFLKFDSATLKFLIINMRHGDPPCRAPHDEYQSYPKSVQHK